jgi:hypothetical protein
VADKDFASTGSRKVDVPPADDLRSPGLLEIGLRCTDVNSFPGIRKLGPLVAVGRPEKHLHPPWPETLALTKQTMAIRTPSEFGSSAAFRMKRC